MFALNVTHHFSFSSDAFSWLLFSLVTLISIALVVGFLTPVLTIIASVAAVANLFSADQTSSVVYILRILPSAALLFLGPGAYSVDARLFGLRVTVVPPRRDKKSTLS